MTFAEALRGAMAARNLTIRDLAKCSSINAQTISNTLHGRSDPRYHTAVVLSVALDWPELIRISERDTRRRCVVCRQTFVTTHTVKTRRRYCSRKCQQTAWGRRRQKSRQTVERAARNKLGGALGAIAKFCAGCEPIDRVCHDARCELREFSPFPLIQVKRRLKAWVPIAKLTRTA